MQQPHLLIYASDKRQELKTVRTILASRSVSRTTSYDVMNDGASLTHNPSKASVKHRCECRKKVAEKKSFNRRSVEVFYDLHNKSLCTHHEVNISASHALKAGFGWNVSGMLNDLKASLVSVKTESEMEKKNSSGGKSKNRHSSWAVMTNCRIAIEADGSRTLSLCHTAMATCDPLMLLIGSEKWTLFLSHLMPDMPAISSRNATVIQRNYFSRLFTRYENEKCRAGPGRML